ncbi:MAG: glycosyltransferase family 2 protein [Bdellovibrionales bacterium]|nr:glycosyltransferase family 2 protein [Bdellovibrionales bacterium]
MKPLFTLICPVHNEEKTVLLFYDRVVKVFDKLSGKYDCNLLFVDNSSTDSTLRMIKGLRDKDDRVFYFGLSANVGYQRSIEFALKNAIGDLLAIIDVDCEDPPEMIVDFLEVQLEGYDIVYGERVDREEGSLMKLARKIFYRITRFVSDEKFFVDMAEFCLMTSEVRDAIVKDQSSFPFIRASIGRVGFVFKGIPYKRHKRIAGDTHYNLFRMTTFAVAGILSSSTLPLRFMAYSFPIVVTIALMSLFFQTSVIATHFDTLLMLYIAMGTMFNAIYIARIYKNGLGRPNANLILRNSVRQCPK